MVPAPVTDSWIQPFRKGALSQQELEQYWEEGYLIKHDLLPTKLLEAAKAAVSRLVDSTAQQLHKAGKITDLCENAGLFDRLTQLESQFPNASVLVHKQGILPPEIAALWSCPELMSIAHQLLGDDVGGHPVWNLRAKTPQQEQATVPWHQDNAYLDPESWKVLQVTAWIPLLDATAQNGCMQVLRRGHQSGRTAKHTCCIGGTWYVQMDEEDAAKQLGVDMAADIMTCEVPFGSVLLLNNQIPHRSLNNLSNQIRWSLDLRWQRPDEPNGFYGLKPCIVMAREGQPDYSIDWESWATVDRNSMQMAAVSKGTQRQVLDAAADDDDLDTVISGPWMDNWELVHHNRHVAAHLASKRRGEQQWTFA